ncbi:hypothetical protein [Micromonospora sp. DT233]|uniref:hypothetical protein n=1 Tax=Micromonospora sp. DT233 TaxID=3393432 RepID=UPI003CEA8775
MLGRGNRKLDGAVTELAEANALIFGLSMLGASPQAEAYWEVERQLDAHPEQARRKVDRLLTHGSPAGRAYAATLLDRIDPAAGRAAWAAMRADPTELVTQTGCVRRRTTLGEYAAGELGKR